MKKLITLLLAALLALSLCACGEKVAPETSDDSAVGSKDSASSEETETAPDTGSDPDTETPATQPETSAEAPSTTEPTEEPEESELEFTKIDGGYALSGIGTCKDTTVVIPATYKGEPVIEIQAARIYVDAGEYGDMYEITGVFDGANVTDVVIPDSVKVIDDYAFANCVTLKTVTIPASVKEIGYGAFMSCTGLQSIAIPEGVETIREATFMYCENLQSITIPASVTSIDKNAFLGCDALETIYFGGDDVQIHEEGNDKLYRLTIVYG